MTVSAKPAVATPSWLSDLLRQSVAASQGSAAWLNVRRAHALERANALSVPTTRDEEWRFTDLAPLRKGVFQSNPAAGPVSADALAPYAVSEARVRLVFVDGRFAPDLSVGAGGAVVPLAQGMALHGAVLEAHLARLAPVDQQLFTALNTAWLRDGAVIYLARNESIEQPVQLLFVTTRPNNVVHPRVLVVAQSGARCTLIEDYVSLTDEPGFTNAVAEVVLADGAQVRHVRLQRESLQAVHIASTAVTVGKDASYTSHSISLGACLSRLNLEVLQTGEGATIHIDGLALIGGDQVADTHTCVDHAVAHGKCVQTHKTIVGGAAHAVFNGKVLVREGAQLTNSAQQSRNLLLSPRARVDTKPQLEIFADDVKCAHGATVGQLDAEHLFYLESRGIPEAQARNLLTYAFGAEIIQRIPVKSLVDQLKQAVLAQTQAAAS